MLTTREGFRDKTAPLGLDCCAGGGGGGGDGCTSDDVGSGSTVDGTACGDIVGVGVGDRDDDDDDDELDATDPDGDAVDPGELT